MIDFRKILDDMVVLEPDTPIELQHLGFDISSMPTPSAVDMRNALQRMLMPSTKPPFQDGNKNNNTNNLTRR